MRNRTLSFGLSLSLTAAALLLTSCGGSAYPEGTAGTGSSSANQTGNNNNNNNNNGNPNPFPSPTPTQTSTGFDPAESFSFSITGAGGVTPSYVTPIINTDTILKVRINAGPAGQIQASNGTYSNYSASYGCVTYNLQVAGQTVVTQTLAPGGAAGALCSGAPDNQVIDFSSRLVPGHGPVAIKVTAAKYDYYCQLWYSGWLYGNYTTYCPMYPVYQTHTVTGTLDVQINGTSF